MLGAKDLLVKIAGDNSSFKKAMSGANTSMGGFASSLKKYAATAALAFAAIATAFAAMTVQMAAAEETVTRQTESILKSQGIMWDSVKDEVTSYLNKLEELTTYGDTDLQLAFNRMASSGMSYNEVMQSMNMVTDIAYTRNISLVAAADLVTKAYNGQGSTFKRHGIIVEDGLKGAEALAAVQSQVTKNMADAEDAANTFEGELRSLKNTTDDFKEAIGAELLDPLTDFVGLLNEGSAESESWGTKIGKALAFPVEQVTNAKRVEQLSIEFNELLDNRNRSEEENLRLQKVRFELITRINGRWEEYTKNNQEFIDQSAKAQEEEMRAEESAYFIQLRKMGATEEYISSLKEEVAIKQQSTAEDEKQLSLAERRAAFDARAATRAGFAGVSGSTMAGLRETAGAYEAGEAYTRTSGGRTITYSGNKSGI